MAPLMPIYTNFERGVRAEKAKFFVQNFPKVPKNAFFVLFFFSFASGAENFIKAPLVLSFLRRLLSYPLVLSFLKFSKGAFNANIY